MASPIASSHASPNPSLNSTLDSELADMDDMSEEQVTKLVQNALVRARQATASSLDKNKRTKTKTATKSPKTPASPTKNTAGLSVSTTNYVQTPPRSHMDALLSPSYDSDSAAGPSPPRLSSPASNNSSDDILRRVEEEIASARKAADDAHRRLADALNPEEDAMTPMELVDILEDHLADDDLRGILDVSSVEDNDDDDGHAYDPVMYEGSKMAIAGNNSYPDVEGEPPSLSPVNADAVTSRVAKVKLTEEEKPKNKKVPPSAVEQRDGKNVKAKGAVTARTEPSKAEVSPWTEKADKVEAEEPVSDDGSEIKTDADQKGADKATGAPENKVRKASPWWWGGGEGKANEVDEDVPMDEPKSPTADGHASIKDQIGAPPPPPRPTPPPKIKRSTEPNTFKELVVDTKNANENVIEERAMSKEVPRTVDNKSRDIEFRFPYPLPAPLPKPRPADAIIAEHALGVPEPFVRFREPKTELKELLEATTGTSVARRSNACGALKVLSTQKKNQLTLVRAKGFLDALVFVVSQEIPKIDKETAIDARSRAVAVLLSVSEPKDNRAAVCAHPGLLEALVHVIREDQGEARAHACGTIAMLAKTAGNREKICQTDGLIETLSIVVRGTIDIHRPIKVPEDNKYVPRATSEGDGPDDEGDESIEDVRSSFSRDSTVPSDEDEPSTQGSSYSDPAFSPRSETDILSVPSSIRKQQGVKYSEHLKRARSNACAAFLHLSKHCPVLGVLCDSSELMDSLISVSREQENTLHTRCLEIVSNLTRFPDNTPKMARNDALISTLLQAGKSKILEDRIFSLQAFQNISADGTSKMLLANSKILTLLSISAMRKDHDEQCAAVAALYNLSTEPSNVVPLTSTRNVVATLVHLAHNSQLHAEIRQMACDALATIGLWLQTLAGSGKVPTSVEKVLLPSHTTFGWQRWD